MSQQTSSQRDLKTFDKELSPRCSRCEKLSALASIIFGQVLASIFYFLYSIGKWLLLNTPVCVVNFQRPGNGFQLRRKYVLRNVEIK